MDINWQELIDMVLAEVKYKTRNRFSFCEDLVSTYCFGSFVSRSRETFIR